MNYFEAREKIIQAYFRDEIKPFDEEFCFCGTLSPNSNWARNSAHPVEILKQYPYSIKEYGRMEKALISRIKKATWISIGMVNRKNSDDNCYSEDELFKGMCAALRVLKTIHKNRGENVDEVQTPFTKRTLELIG